MYGSLEMRAGRHGTLTLGLRYEQRSADYADSSDLPFPRARDRMPGGNLSWLWDAGATRQYYATLSRGYKAGGFNIGADVDPARGASAPSRCGTSSSGCARTAAMTRVSMQADVYAMRRVSMQVYSSRQLLPDNPLTYVFFTGNAAHGDNLGVEGELQWRPACALDAVGIAVAAEHALPGVHRGWHCDLRGRGQAYAPDWQFALAAGYAASVRRFRAPRPAGAGRLLLQRQPRPARGAARARQPARRLARQGWTASLWARNLLNAHYAVDGFYFGDEPPDFPTRLYLQNGDPRQVGATVSYDLGAH